MRIRSETFWIHYCVGILLQAWITSQVGSRTPFKNDPDCPRRPELTDKRQCLKKCRTKEDCKGRNKECLCDEACGWSCVKPRRRCGELQPLYHGSFVVDPVAQFGSKVTYTCDEGYFLSGHKVRVCQGDGTWSGLRPTCATEAAPDVPTVWRALPGKCKNPLLVANAKHDGVPGESVFQMGAQLTYTCNPGFKADGFRRAMCVGEGRWVGPKMTCTPRRCGHPEEIVHGERIGDAFMYPHKVTYKCDEGYLMEGRSWRNCQYNGEWSGVPPVCRPVKCPQLMGPPNGHRVGSGNTYGSILEYSCLHGFKLSGSKTRKCQHNGTWSGSDVTCSVVDCGNPGPFYNGYIDYTSSTSHTTYGSTIIFKCFGGATFEGHSAFSKCEATGVWSNPVPYCWNKCKVPAIENGSALNKDVDAPVMHSAFISYQCDPDFEPVNKSGPSCYNGTLSYRPFCRPRSCYTRPSSIRDGMVRYYSVRHGDKARYRCNTGYQLKGNTFVECRYGHWVGELPVCLPVLCEHPGSIENGKIMLVGMIGKYLYRQYVKDVGHNDHIEFHCNKGFKRKGPMGATCVDGKWSPDEIPVCVPGKHPQLQYMYRGRRDLESAPRPPTQNVENLQGQSVREDKARYLKKLEVVGLQECPYQTLPSKWQNNAKSWPDVEEPDIYDLFNTPGAHTKAAMKNLKSLEAYNQFQSGWVGPVR